MNDTILIQNAETSAEFSPATALVYSIRTDVPVPAFGRAVLFAALSSLGIDLAVPWVIRKQMKPGEC